MSKPAGLELSINQNSQKLLQSFETKILQEENEKDPLPLPGLTMMEERIVERSFYDNPRDPSWECETTWYNKRKWSHLMTEIYKHAPDEKDVLMEQCPQQVIPIESPKDLKNMGPRIIQTVRKVDYKMSSYLQLVYMAMHVFYEELDYDVNWDSIKLFMNIYLGLVNGDSSVNATYERSVMEQYQLLVYYKVDFCLYPLINLSHLGEGNIVCPNMNSFEVEKMFDFYESVLPEVKTVAKVIMYIAKGKKKTTDPFPRLFMCNTLLERVVNTLAVSDNPTSKIQFVRGFNLQDFLPTGNLKIERTAEKDTSHKNVEPKDKAVKKKTEKKMTVIKTAGVQPSGSKGKDKVVGSLSLSESSKSEGGSEVDKSGSSKDSSSSSSGNEARTPADKSRVKRKGDVLAQISKRTKKEATEESKQKEYRISDDSEQEESGDPDLDDVSHKELVRWVYDLENSNTQLSTKIHGLERLVHDLDQTVSKQASALSTMQSKLDSKRAIETTDKMKSIFKSKDTVLAEKMKQSDHGGKAYHSSKSEKDAFKPTTEQGKMDEVRKILKKDPADARAAGILYNVFDAGVSAPNVERFKRYCSVFLEAIGKPMEIDDETITKKGKGTRLKFSLKSAKSLIKK